jgi:GNAT superfamily N-acetyltransferase
VTRSRPVLTVTDSIAAEAREVIRRGLHDYNVAQSGVDDRRELAVLVRDAQTRQTLGGLLGRTSLGMLLIDVFFLPEHLRGNGLGSRVLGLAEEEARRRGCTTAVLTTLSFQAPGFYARHGYETFGQVEAQPGGASRIFMRKALR